jgi:hypothetical protein
MAGLSVPAKTRAFDVFFRHQRIDLRTRTRIS